MAAHKGNLQAQKKAISGYYINHGMKSSSYTREKYCGNVPCYGISVWAKCGNGWVSRGEERKEVLNSK